MKFKFLYISLIIIYCSIPAAENGAQPTSQFPSWLQKLRSGQIRSQPIQKLGAWLKGLKHNLIEYAKNSLPKTKKEWVLTIISEGIAEGILMFKGLSMLVTYKKDKAEDLIEKSQGFWGLFTGDLTEIERDKVEEEITQIMDNVVEQTGMKEKVTIHYTGTSGAFAYGKSHLFIPTKYTLPLSGQAKKEFAFIAAHELGHIQSKDNLKFAAAAIAAPLLTLATTKTLDKATNIIIDKLIKTMKLSKNSRGYKILTKFKAGKGWILRNTIVRYLIAANIFAAYSRYVEKQADLFAAQHGYKEGGVIFFERLEEMLTPLQKSFDVLHPTPAERARYLKEYN